MSEHDFVAFPKIPRLMRGIVITEKIDGTNAQVSIRLASGAVESFVMGLDTQVHIDGQMAYIRAGSRNRWLTNDGSSDNFGFGRWVYNNAPELALLGIGRHYGEWWGCGIQRGYDLAERRFSLFNVGRWSPDQLPECCHVVPVLGAFPTFSDAVIDDVLEQQRLRGSIAAPGYAKPEGIVVYHKASGQLFKRLLENDDIPKSQSFN